MICGGTARTTTPTPTIRAYAAGDVDEKPAGGVSPRTIADTAATMPTPAIAGSPADLDRTHTIGLGAPELDRRREHEQVHAHVEDHRHVLQQRERRRGV